MKKLPPVVKRFCGASLFFLLGIAAVFLYPFSISEPDITAEVIYVRYACGDCYVRTKILKVRQLHAAGNQKLVDRNDPDITNQNDIPVRFIGWDVLVFYKGDDEAISRYLDAHLDTSGDCMAPTFKLTGQLKRRLIYSLLYKGDRYDGTYFDAKSAVAVGDPSPTCKQAKEAPL